MKSTRENTARRRFLQCILIITLIGIMTFQQATHTNTANAFSFRDIFPSSKSRKWSIPVHRSDVALPEAGSQAEKNCRNLRGFTTSLRPAVISGPSGVGKGTLIEMLMASQETDNGGIFGFSVSHTTRSPRPGEIDGVHYHFTTMHRIKRDISEGKFIEHAEVHGNIYGTSYQSVKAVQQAGKICILDIDIQGAELVKKSALDPVLIFIAPPSMEVLEARLRGRGTEAEEAITKRLGNAQREVTYGTKEGNFQHVVVNNDREVAFQDLRRVFQQLYPQFSF